MLTYLFLLQNDYNYSRKRDIAATLMWIIHVHGKVWNLDYIIISTIFTGQHFLGNVVKIKKIKDRVYGL